MFFERSGFHVFTFRDIDVSVSFWYLFLMVLIFLMGGGLIGGLSFVVAATLALLVHEFGHAFVSKHYSLRPSILLHGFGGLCMHEPADTDAKDAWILFAGPLAGIAFGAIAFAVWWFVLPNLALPGRADTLLSTFVWALVYTNLGWSAINLLLPVFPLDGGQLFHLLLRRFTDESTAQTWALRISLGLIIPLGILAMVVWHSFYIGILALFIGMDNYNSLKHGRQLIARQAKERATDFQKQLLADMESAMQAGDWREAYRLGHQLRHTGKLPQKMMDQIWDALALSAAQIGECDEARSYIDRAGDTKRARQARAICEAASDAA